MVLIYRVVTCLSLLQISVRSALRHFEGRDTFGHLVAPPSTAAHCIPLGINPLYRIKGAAVEGGATVSGQAASWSGNTFAGGSLIWGFYCWFYILA